MIIQQDGSRLIQAAAVRVVGTDEWSVTVEARGLTDAGDVTTFRIVMSRNEVTVIAHAARARG